MSRETIERKCILDGTVKPQSELLRFVELNNTLLPDFNKKLPGKGMYITNNRFSLEKALEKKLFHKVSRHNLKIAENFVETIEELIKQKALETLNLARKSGALVTGFEKVKEAVKKNQVKFIIEATNAGTDGKEKVALFAKNIEIFNLFSIDELDMCLNKENTVHIAILKSDIAVMVYQNLKRYQNFLSDGEDNK
ncbi:MAG: DUF448 domain-containing protein [Alphaproteobacteria bacterium]|nr:DUF448 domain-containing protein [Alphaproteobacteria bacterium]